MNSAVEWIAKIPRRSFRAALFDFDGTISLIREGWQPIMYSYFVEVLEETPDAQGSEVLLKVVQEFVDKLTGKQTIYQCIRLGEEVTKRKGKAVDPLVYKQEYLARLQHHISDRVAFLKQAKVSPTEFLVPGAKGILENLRSRGITLYLVSGTDHEFVVDEAKSLGVSEFFNGGIYGAVDRYETFSKEQVIRELVLPKIGSGDLLLGFGDGFVEIENVKAVGGVAIGVATDEKRRTGVDAWKRSRLISAGADGIIGDFLCQDELLTGLFPKN